MEPCIVGAIYKSPRSVTLVSPAKMAEPIEMLFGPLARRGPRNHPVAMRDVAMATIFWLSIYGVHIGATGEYD